MSAVELLKVRIVGDINVLDVGVADIQYKQLWIFRHIDRRYPRHIGRQAQQIGTLRRIEFRQ